MRVEQSNQWWYVKAGTANRVGPVDANQILNLVTMGVIERDCWLCAPSIHNQWILAKDVEGLFDTLRQTHSQGVGPGGQPYQNMDDVYKSWGADNMSPNSGNWKQSRTVSPGWMQTNPPRSEAQMAQSQAGFNFAQAESQLFGNAQLQTDAQAQAFEQARAQQQAQANAYAQAQAQAQAHAQAQARARQQAQAQQQMGGNNFGAWNNPGSQNGQQAQAQGGNGSWNQGATSFKEAQERARAEAQARMMREMSQGNTSPQSQHTQGQDTLAQLQAQETPFGHSKAKQDFFSSSATQAPEGENTVDRSYNRSQSYMGHGAQGQQQAQQTHQGQSRSSQYGHVQGGAATMNPNWAGQQSQAQSQAQAEPKKQEKDGGFYNNLSEKDLSEKSWQNLTLEDDPMAGARKIETSEFIRRKEEITGKRDLAHNRDVLHEMGYNMVYRCRSVSWLSYFLSLGAMILFAFMAFSQLPMVDAVRGKLSWLGTTRGVAQLSLYLFTASAIFFAIQEFRVNYNFAKIFANSRDARFSKMYPALEALLLFIPIVRAKSLYSLYIQAPKCYKMVANELRNSACAPNIKKNLLKVWAVAFFFFEVGILFPMPYGVMGFYGAVILLGIVVRSNMLTIVNQFAFKMSSDVVHHS